MLEQQELQDSKRFRGIEEGIGYNRGIERKYTVEGIYSIYRRGDSRDSERFMIRIERVSCILHFLSRFISFYISSHISLHLFTSQIKLFFFSKNLHHHGL